MLKPRVFPDHEAVSRCAAEWITARLRERPASLLCLASGATPTRTYQLLVEHGLREAYLFNQCRILKLDEWGGLPADDPAWVSAATPESPQQMSPVMIILDASGSMNTADAPGPRIDAAKQAVVALVEALPEGSPVGLLVYGTGRYRFRDFFLLGSGLTLIAYLVSLALVPVLWPFRAA